MGNVPKFIEKHAAEVDEEDSLNLNALETGRKKNQVFR